jgi:hypothetical protein
MMMDRQAAHFEGVCGIAVIGRDGSGAFFMESRIGEGGLCVWPVVLGIWMDERGLDAMVVTDLDGGVEQAV